MDLITIVVTLAGVSTAVMKTPPCWSLKKRALIPREQLHVSVKETSRTVNAYRALMESMQREGRLVYNLGITSAAVVYGSALIFRVTTYNYAFKHHYISTSNGEPILYKAIVFCGLTGLVSDVASNPYNVTRTRMQLMVETNSDPRFRCVQPNTSGSMFKHLLRGYGYSVLLMGIPACIPRGFISSSSHLLSYCLVKDIIHDNFMTTIHHSDVETCTVAAVIGAAVSCFCVAPFDVILARLHTQPLYFSGRGLLYEGVKDCALKIYRNEGLGVFYKGVGMLCLKVCPGTAVSLIIWDLLTPGSLGFYHTEFLENLSNY